MPDRTEILRHRLSTSVLDPGRPRPCITPAAARPKPCPKHEQACECGGPLALYPPTALACLRCRRRYIVGAARPCNCISRAEAAALPDPGELLVFFATARGPHTRGKARRLSALIRWLSWSPLAHVAIGFNGAVLDPSMSGNRFYELDRFLAHFPTLHSVFVVPTTHQVNLDRFRLGTPKPVWPTIRRWLVGGTWDNFTPDCVCTALQAMAWGGLAPPASITTPRHLYRWLESKGYERHDLAAVGDRDSARQRLAH